MKLPNESNVKIRGIKYALLKAKPMHGDGYIFVVDDPHKAKDNIFLTPDEILALVAMANTKTA